MLGANLKGGGGLICVVDASVAGSILHPVSRQRVGGLMFAVNFVLVPANPLSLVPSFLTLWPELDNRGGWVRGGWIDGDVGPLLANQNRPLCEDD